MCVYVAILAPHTAFTAKVGGKNHGHTLWTYIFFLKMYVQRIFFYCNVLGKNHGHTLFS